LLLLVGAVAVAAVAGGARSARTDTGTLLARYAPLFYAYRGDWQPISVETYLGASDLERLSNGRWVVVRSSPPATALPRGGKSLQLDVRGCSAEVNLQPCYLARVRPATRGTLAVYGRAWVSPTAAAGPVTSVLQYWVLYAVDDWRNSLTKPTIWQLHEGDWEFVSVALDAAQKPVAVAYSQHNLGVRRAWSAAPKTGTHPISYVALGSHTNYAARGRHTIPASFSGIPLTPPDFTAAETSFGPGKLASAELRVVDVSDGRAPWLAFAGAWGDGNYVILGYTSSYGFKASSRFLAGDSPPGPAFHRTWKDPLLPFRSWPLDDGH
jgi:hypothetical protein